MKQNKLFRLMEWIGFIMGLFTLSIGNRYFDFYVNLMVISLGGLITFSGYFLRKRLEKDD
ncbi:hypothetical protein CLPU_11c00040 [Gottschalkia purinilytica]|uniref:Uncharacterized protein n=1 Tax=Gottschalkia purinilytica TaxID=1503 RepID=A0A0L0W8R5_GOTPU|nr:hypothetical protein [Gottschalkia purinilytica]KNF07836.1 hypothetical protein CLPU_11c00040 [Gottschalkia purinilytica]